MGLDRRLMRRFAYKMMNPMYYRRARGILRSYNYAALQDPYAVGSMIDSLCMACGDTITPAQRSGAIRFVSIKPQQNDQTAANAPLIASPVMTIAYRPGRCVRAAQRRRRG